MDHYPAPLGDLKCALDSANTHFLDFLFTAAFLASDQPVISQLTACNKSDLEQLKSTPRHELIDVQALGVSMMSPRAITGFTLIESMTKIVMNETGVIRSVSRDLPIQLVTAQRKASGSGSVGLGITNTLWSKIHLVNVGLFNLLCVAARVADTDALAPWVVGCERDQLLPFKGLSAHVRDNVHQVKYPLFKPRFEGNVLQQMLKHGANQENVARALATGLAHKSLMGRA